MNYIVPIRTLRDAVKEACFQTFKGKVKEEMFMQLCSIIEEYISDECKQTEDS